jgi:hypothetical protein
MKSRLKIAGVLLLVCVIISGCGSDIAGTYQHEGTKETLILTKDGKFLLEGNSGSYSVENKTIIITTSMVGGAKGKVSGSKLVFPEVGTNEIVGFHFKGIWAKQ